MAQTLSPTPHTLPPPPNNFGLLGSPTAFHLINSLVSLRYVSMSCLFHSSGLSIQHRAWLGLNAQNQCTMSLRADPGGRKLKWPEAICGIASSSKDPAPLPKPSPPYIGVTAPLLVSLQSTSTLQQPQQTFQIVSQILLLPGIKPSSPGR